MSAEDKPQPRASDPQEPPRARTLFRQGAVYGLAGAMKAADVAVAAARGAVRGAREGAGVADREGAGVADREGVEVADREGVRIAYRETTADDE